MNLRNILWTYAPRKDGSCQIRIYVHHQGKKKYFGTGLNVQPDDWDQHKGEVKRTHPLSQRYNAAVQRQRMEIERHFLDGGTWRSLSKKEKHGNDLIAFGRQIISEIREGRLPITQSTAKNYLATCNRLTEFSQEKGLLFDQIDQDFYEAFSRFLNSKGCGLATVGNHMKIIKRLMNLGLERDLHQNRAHCKKAFRAHKPKSRGKVYLTEAEIEQLEKLDLSATPALEQERDRWLIAYHFLMRFSDVIRLRQENFVPIGDRIYCKYRSVKTGTEAILPVKERALTLLEQYNYTLDFSSNQQANRHLKTICAMAGLNTLVEQGDQSGPKSSFVTTHTARRSAATNLYLNKASLELIAKLGGWESGDTVRVYLQASGLDSALLASDLAFFK